MNRYWWTVWIKVAVLAAAFLIAYGAVSGYLGRMIGPYRIDAPTNAESEPVKIESAEDETGAQGSSNALNELIETVERKVGIYISYEDFIFDFANDYATRMMEESERERTITEKPLS